MKKIIVILLILAAVWFVFRKSAGTGGNARRGKVPVEAVTVKVEPAQRKNLELKFSYVGSIKAKDESTLFSKVSGKFLQYTAKDGDTVKAGDIVALIERDETGMKYEPAKVLTPISGVVARTYLDKGVNVTPQATAVALVINMEDVIAQVNVSEAHSAYFKPGLDAVINVDAFPQDNFEGMVTKVSQTLDGQTRTLPVEITVPNPEGKLKSGMFGRALVTVLSRPAAITLRQDAVVYDDDTTSVFAVQDNIAKKTPVKLGVRDDGNIEIIEGLNEGQIIIVFGQQGLKDGAKVTIEQ